MHLLERVQSLLDLRDNYNHCLTEEGNLLIRDLLARFFTENPLVKEIRWRQYTPYFNDGDLCVFTVHSPVAIISEKDNEKYHLVEKDDFTVVDSNGNITVEGYTYSGRSRLEENLCGLSDTLRDLGFVLEKVYGDDAEIIVTKDGITVEEFEHD